MSICFFLTRHAQMSSGKKAYFNQLQGHCNSHISEATDRLNHIYCSASINLLPGLRAQLLSSILSFETALLYFFFFLYFLDIACIV